MVNLDALLTAKLLGNRLGVSTVLVRKWAQRYPDRLPVRGRSGGRPLYRYGDGVEVELMTRRSAKSTRR